MTSFQFDQAEGLRRLLGEPQQHLYNFLSTLSQHKKNSILFNLADSLSRSGRDVLLVDATCSKEGVGYFQANDHVSATLVKVASHEYDIDDAFYRVPQGFDVVCVANSTHDLPKKETLKSDLNQVFSEVSAEADIVLVDARLERKSKFPLHVMAEAAQVLLVQNSQNSIKEAYGLIKQVVGHFGRMPFGVLVSGSSKKRAEAIFHNMAQTASRYLGVSLYSMGYLPEDDHIDLAADLGRSVIDAFPMALSSFAFRQIADTFSGVHLGYQSNLEMVGV